MEDQMLTYPTDKVVGVAPDRGIVQAARTALQASGVDESRIEVLGGENAGRAEPTDEDDDGLLASVIRTVRTGLGEEATRLRQLNEAIDAGRFVIQVDLPGEDGDERDDEKRAVGNALHDAGVSHVAFYGRLTVEELQIGA
jgi:hypothetical protein